MTAKNSHDSRKLLVWRVQQWIDKCAANGKAVDTVVIHPKNADEAWTVRAKFPHLTIKILGEDSYAIPAN